MGGKQRQEQTVVNDSDGDSCPSTLSSTDTWRVREVLNVHTRADADLPPNSKIRFLATSQWQIRYNKLRDSSSVFSGFWFLVGFRFRFECLTTRSRATLSLFLLGAHPSSRHLSGDHNCSVADT